MTRFFTWGEFDESVEYIANSCKLLKLKGIYGVPRGGLCLAVALSHKLNLEIIDKPKQNCLIVDDVYETGYTLNNFKNIEGAQYFVLFSKKTPTWWSSVNLKEDNEWIVFPWENKKNASTEKSNYEKKRGAF